jgi:hypothetical protein
LGLLFIKRGRYPEAIRCFEKIYRQFPDDVETAYLLGLAFKELGRLDEAVELLENVIRARADHYMVHFHLGGSLLRLGQTAKGMAHMREYERLRAAQANPRQGHPGGFSQAGPRTTGQPFLGEVTPPSSPKVNGFGKYNGYNHGNGTGKLNGYTNGNGNGNKPPNGLLGPVNLAVIPGKMSQN